MRLARAVVDGVGVHKHLRLMYDIGLERQDAFRVAGRCQGRLFFVGAVSQGGALRADPGWCAAAG